MFYSHLVISEKNSLGKIWIAAHFEKKLTKAQVVATNIEESCDAIMSPVAPMALRLSGQLLLGVARIYGRKVEFLFIDCNDALSKIKMAFQPEVVATTVPVSTITLPEVTFEEHDIEDIFFSKKSKDGMTAVEFNLKHTARDATDTLLKDITPSDTSLSWNFDDQLGLDDNSQGLEDDFFDEGMGQEIHQFREEMSSFHGDEEIPSFSHFEDELGTPPFPEQELNEELELVPQIDELQPLAPIAKRARRNRKKRKAAIVDDLSSQIDVIQNQKDTSDIVMERDFAPPSKRRMLEEHRSKTLLEDPVFSCFTYNLPRCLHSLFEARSPGEEVDGVEEDFQEFDDANDNLTYGEGDIFPEEPLGEGGNLDDGLGGFGEDMGDDFDALCAEVGADEEEIDDRASARENWTNHTGIMHKFLKAQFDRSQDRPISFHKATRHIEKKGTGLLGLLGSPVPQFFFNISILVAGMFFELLVLQNSGAIEVAQKKPYGTIQVRPTVLFSLFFFLCFFFFFFLIP